MTTETTQAKKPTHRIYIVTGEGENAHWNPVAAAWAHKDGNGFNMTFDVLPLKGRIVMRKIKEKDAYGDGNGGPK